MALDPVTASIVIIVLLVIVVLLCYYQGRQEKEETEEEEGRQGIESDPLLSPPYGNRGSHRYYNDDGNNNGNNNNNDDGGRYNQFPSAMAQQQQPQPPHPQQPSQQFHEQAEWLIPAEVRMISGCEDYQTSADVAGGGGAFAGGPGVLPNPAGRAGGACTSALLDVLYQHEAAAAAASSATNGHRGDQHQQQRRRSPGPFRFRSRSRNNSNGGAVPPTGKTLSFQEVLMRLREKLSNDGFSQIPQLTSSRPLDLEQTPFQLVGHGRGGGNGGGTGGGGTDRALLVGINYVGQNGELRGCHNDVHRMREYLAKVHGYDARNVTVLLDDGNHPYPTRAKMIKSLQNLVQRSQPGDSVFFHYSGHGGLLEPESNAYKFNNSEYDRTLIPLDHGTTGQIRDFSLFHHFVRPMKSGVVMTCVMDCCHSGSVLDLPYSFRATNVGESPRMIENVSHLSNLAFLYMLAGGVLPDVFGGLLPHLADVVGGNLDDYQGLGLQQEDAQIDFVNSDDGDDDDGDYGNGDDDAAGGGGGGGGDDDDYGNGEGGNDYYDDGGEGGGEDYDVDGDPATMDRGLGFGDGDGDNDDYGPGSPAMQMPPPPPPPPDDAYDPGAYGGGYYDDGGGGGGFQEQQPRGDAYDDGGGGGDAVAGGDDDGGGGGGFDGCDLMGCLEPFLDGGGGGDYGGDGGGGFFDGGGDDGGDGFDFDF